MIGKNNLSNSKINQLNIPYLGIQNPKTPAEIEFEISGLKNLICEANSRIAQLEQAKCLAELTKESILKTNSKEEK